MDMLKVAPMMLSMSEPISKRFPTLSLNNSTLAEDYSFQVVSHLKSKLSGKIRMGILESNLESK